MYATLLYVLQPTNYNHVTTKRREYTQDSSQAELGSCSRHVVNLKKQVSGLARFFLNTAQWFIVMVYNSKNVVKNSGSVKPM